MYHIYFSWIITFLNIIPTFFIFIIVIIIIIIIIFFIKETDSWTQIHRILV